jgi:hypothetical protein
MIRGLAPLLLLIGFLAALPSGGGHSLTEGPTDLQTQAVLELATRTAEPTSPGDEPSGASLQDAFPVSGAATTIHASGRAPCAVARPLHTPFRARAPPVRDVLT